MTKNPDYTGSAVKLFNNPLLEVQLRKLHGLQQQLNSARAEFDASAVGQAIKAFALDIGELQAEIREAVEKHGSYQSIEDGLYAVKQRRQSITYSPAEVRRRLGKFADALIEEQVNSEAMEGLVKGGLVSRDQAQQCGTVSETFAYIIKV